MAEEGRLLGGGGEFVKFEYPGREYVGVFKGTGKTTGGEYGEQEHVILFTDEKKTVKFNFYPGMRSAIEQVEVGQRIRVRFIGDQPSKKRKGKTFKAFEVYAL